MRAEDIPSLLEIESVSGTPPWTRGMFDAELALPSSLTLVAYESGGKRPVAFAAARVAPDKAHLIELAVHPGFRDRGVGGELLRRLTGRAREKGCKKMELEFREDNLPAKKLYESAGFTAVGQRKGFYETSENGKKIWKDAVLMSCDI